MRVITTVLGWVIDTATDLAKNSRGIGISEVLGNFAPPPQRCLDKTVLQWYMKFVYYTVQCCREFYFRFIWWYYRVLCKHVMYCPFALFCVYFKKKVKVCIAVNGNPSHSYGVSLAIWDHTVLPAVHPTQVSTPRLNPSHTGRYSIYLPQRDGRLSWPRWLVTYRNGLPARRRSPIQVLTGHGVD